MKSNKNDEVKLDRLHFNRYQVERRLFRPQLDKYREGTLFKQFNSPEYEAAVNEIDGVFPETLTQFQKWETIQREESYRSILRDWKDSGSAIFALRDDLVKMFLDSDVLSVPINSIRMPYGSFYCHLGDADVFPDFHPDYRVDGFYMHAETSYLAFWEHAPEPNRGALRAEAQRMLEYSLSVVNDPDRHDEDSVILCGRDIQKYGGIDGYVENYAEARYRDWEKREKRFQTFLDDPDSFDYAEHNDLYLTLFLDFTVVRKDGVVRPCSPEGLEKEPFLRAIYDFETHRSTIGEAIEFLYKESIIPVEHHFEAFDPYGGQVSLSDPGYSWGKAKNPVTGEESPAYPARINSPLNVTNRPELLQDMTRLAFNTLCYLNWKDKDVTLKYPNQKLTAEEKSAKTQKDRKKVDFKARNQGCRKLFFCGYSYPYSSQENCGTGRAGTTKSHWRRGHWRNQPFGKGLRETKLLWIKPVIVAKETSTPTQPTIYKV